MLTPLYFLSPRDRHYRKDMTLDQAVALMKRCFVELKQRFIVHFPSFACKVVDKDGVREIEITI